MSEIIRVHDQYYILATSPLADAQTRVLKQDNTFAIFDLFGDVRGLARGEQGLFHRGTRHLSHSILKLGDERPLVLGSAVTEDNVVFAVDMTNPDTKMGDVEVPRGTMHIFRSIFLWEGVCYERFRFFNYSEGPLEATMSVSIEADFADIFEVRGFPRSSRGTLHPPEIVDGALMVRYDGLDGISRCTRVVASQEATFEGTDVVFRVEVPPRSPRETFLAIECESSLDVETTLLDQPVAIVRLREEQQRLAEREARISTSNDLFDAWTERSLADLRMMVTNTEHGPFPYAGVPWFAAPFGRDSIITAYQMLWVDPDMARAVLSFLAANQADEVDLERESEPGKILHEQRTGELANLGEVPFGKYYGSVDSTPLFVALAGQYFAHTHDTAFLDSIWPNIEAALEWMDRYGDIDGDGLLEYKGSERGLVQQGWKDSHDAVFHADGGMAPPPIALCEVQAYAYWALRGAARIARALGKRGRAVQLEERSETLRKTFEATFWLPELGVYALALDGQKRPCEVRSSNAGHCLLTGIASAERGKVLAETLLSDSFFSGWGIRTLATSEARYGPITYHNGSIWPHDNSLIAQGLARYGHKDGVHKIMSALLDASEHLEFHRLPELYSGFPRRPGQGPIEYPLACAPQAWAAGSVFLLLRASLGLSVDAEHKQVVFKNPTLPSFLREVQIDGIRVGDAEVDLSFLRHRPDSVGVQISERRGDVELVVVT